ncbi:MAG: hypothetical protein OXG35_23990 [Acidobacteria bacterium]|nr:hypothetical protein [Acidobacteriota bacterium]
MSALPSLSRLFAAPAPSAGIEIAADRVTGVVLDRERRVAAGVSRPLPPGAVTPAVNAANLVEPDTVRDVVREVRESLPGAPRRLALVVPDSAAKVSLLRFDKVPARAADLDQLVRWQARKTAPFRIEDAQVACAPGAPVDGGGREFVVSLMRRDIVEEYEGACARAGGHAGGVDLASFGVIDAVLAGGRPAEPDWLLVHAAGGYLSIAVVRQGHLILFRHQPGRDGDDDDALVDLVHQTTMYYEDRLEGAGDGRVGLAVSSEGADARASGYLRRLGVVHVDSPLRPIAAGRPAEPPRPGGALSDVIAAPAGLLLREHTASGASA